MKIKNDRESESSVSNSKFPESVRGWSYIHWHYSTCSMRISLPSATRPPLPVWYHFSQNVEHRKKFNDRNRRGGPKFSHHNKFKTNLLTFYRRIGMETRFWMPSKTFLFRRLKPRISAIMQNLWNQKNLEIMGKKIFSANDINWIC